MHVALDSASQITHLHLRLMLSISLLRCYVAALIAYARIICMFVALMFRQLFRFGDGISYTSFATRNLSLSATVVHTADCAVLNVSVTVTNTGEVAGDEVTQVYISRKGTKSQARTSHSTLVCLARIVHACTSITACM